MIPLPLLLAVAAVALYVLPLIVPKAPEPDDIALPPVPGGPTPNPAVCSSSFVAAVDAYDLLAGFIGDRRYAPDEAAEVVKALRTLRLALIQPPATPPASEVVE
jgi:hypothetical protein